MSRFEDRRPRLPLSFPFCQRAIKAVIKVLLLLFFVNRKTPPFLARNSPRNSPLLAVVRPEVQRSWNFSPFFSLLSEPSYQGKLHLQFCSCYSRERNTPATIIKFKGLPVKSRSIKQRNSVREAESNRKKGGEITARWNVFEMFIRTWWVMANKPRRFRSGIR